MNVLKVSGVSGSGKTTILSAIKRDYMSRGYTVLDISSLTKEQIVRMLPSAESQSPLVLLVDDTGPHMADWLTSREVKALAPNALVIYTWLD